MRLVRFDTAHEAGTALAAGTAASLAAGITRNGAASLAVPGGRTPVPLFEALRGSDLDWRRVQVTLTDERHVPESDPGSNAALVKRTLLQGPASAAGFLPLYRATADIAADARAVTQDLARMALPFDAVVLGMGEDGHFASLFPASPGLAEALDAHAAPACVPMRASAAPHERLSLNVAALVRTRRLFLFITGEAKLALLQRAAGGDAMQWPVAALLALREPPLEVFWAGSS